MEKCLMSEEKEKSNYLVDTKKCHLTKENEWINKDLSQCHGKTNEKHMKKMYREGKFISYLFST